MTRLIAVASGKGGVGKTWLAISLAAALARRGARTLLCDGDLGLANVDVQLGITPVATLADVLAGRRTLDDAAITYRPDFSIIPGCSGSGRLSLLAPAAIEALMLGLRQVSTGYDYVVLDLGSGVEDAVRRMAALADVTLVIATDEPTSMTDAYAVLKLHAADHGSSGGVGAAQLVINMAGSEPQGHRTYAALARACATFLGFAPPLAGIIRRDTQVREAIRRQTLLLDLASRSPAASDVSALADRLLPPAESGWRLPEGSVEHVRHSAGGA